jgi:UvrD/REP helicase N-terminal domain
MRADSLRSASDLRDNRGKCLSDSLGCQDAAPSTTEERLVALKRWQRLLWVNGRHEPRLLSTSVLGPEADIQIGYCALCTPCKLGLGEQERIMAGVWIGHEPSAPWPARIISPLSIRSNAAPLLIIAGAGSGKTNTLAHRVTHLIVHGADPSRILLLTFSRRAAAEMERRAERIIAAALGVTGLGTRSPISWAGTFHAVGARLLRMYAGSVGLDPSFTIHDRADSADLINLMRHELRLSEKAKRFPLKDTCLAIYSRSVNATEPLCTVLRRA